MCQETVPGESPEIQVCWAVLRQASMITSLGVEGKERGISEILAV